MLNKKYILDEFPIGSVWAYKKDRWIYLGDKWKYVGKSRSSSDPFPKKLIFKKHRKDVYVC